MSGIVSALRTALRMSGDSADVANDASLASIDAVLRSRGLKLAVVDSDKPRVLVSAYWMLWRAHGRAIESGKAERGLVMRLAALIGRDPSRVNRAMNNESDLDDESRDLLQAHLLDPVKHPLPPKAKDGRPVGSGAASVRETLALWAQTDDAEA